MSYFTLFVIEFTEYPLLMQLYSSSVPDPRKENFLSFTQAFSEVARERARLPTDLACVGAYGGDSALPLFASRTVSTPGKSLLPSDLSPCSDCTFCFLTHIDLDCLYTRFGAYRTDWRVNEVTL